MSQSSVAKRGTVASSWFWSSDKPDFIQINTHYEKKKNHENNFSQEQFPFPSSVTLKYMPNVSKSLCFILFN